MTRRRRPTRLTLVALGDSVPAGARCWGRAFPALLARSLGPRTRTRNLARRGQTTRGLLTQLEEPRTRVALGTADAVVLTVGANDVDESLAHGTGCDDPSSCAAEDLDRLLATLQRVLRRVRELAPDGVPVVVTGYWNVLRDGQVAAAHGPAYVATSTALTALVNARIATASATTGAHFVDLAAAFARSGDVTRLLAADGDHPNARGHRRIADAVAPVLQHALASSGHPVRP